MTIIEVCEEFDCDYRIVHEINTDGYIVDGVVVKAPDNQLMYQHKINLHMKVPNANL